MVSRARRATADAFAGEHGGIAAIVGVAGLLTRADVDAVYVATPTVSKEAIALAAIEAGKHVLVDKPFMDAASIERIRDAAVRRRLVFMDATHFVHHPRTRAIRESMAARIGKARSMHSAFYFPLSEPGNIRFDTTREPMGALGDMAWYSMRAVVEYLRPTGTASRISAVAERDADTGAITRASGLLGFTTGETSTFDVGYTAGTVIMDLSLYGTHGIITMDDFVLDWTNSFAFQADDTAAGYVCRAGESTRKDFGFVPTPSDVSQDVLMIENFARFAETGDRSASMDGIADTLRTQRYLDALWSTLG